MESRQQLLQLVGAHITGSPPNIKIFKQLQVLVGTTKYTAETLGSAATTQQVREAADIIARWSAQHAMAKPKRSGDMGKYHADGHLRDPVFPVAKGSVPSEGRATPPLPHPGDHHPRNRKNRGPSAGTSQLGKKTQCRSLFLRTKGLCALLLELPPRPPPNLQEGGQRAIFQRPPVYLGNKPTPPGRREASEVAQTASLLSRRRQRLPRPSPAPPRRPPADESREGPRGRAESRGSGPAQPAHLPLPGPAHSPAPPAPEPREGRAPGSTAGRRPRPREPQAAREAGTLGLSGGQRLPPEPARTPGA